jgi:DNA invertase Pin-like site-specific DNA recombinase
MNAVIYARYSSHNQREESIEGQLRKCREFADRNGFTIIEEYCDRAISGKTDDRYEFQRMMKDSEKGHFQVLIMYTMDRFARNRYDSAVHKAKLRKNGVKIYYTEQSISDEPEGIILESVLEGMAEYYSENLSRGVRRGLTENALKCMATTKPPIGYILNKEKKFEIDPVTAPIIREAFDLYANGKSMRQIVDIFNEKGYRTARGNPFRIGSLDRILVNVKYTGVFKYEDIVIEGGVPAIIDKEVFERVQKMLSKNRRQSGKMKNPEAYLLTGKLYCGECGELMTGDSGTSKTGKIYNYYKCFGRRKSACHKTNERKEWVEQVVVEETIKQILQPDIIRQIAKKVTELAEQEFNDTSRVESLKSELKSTQKSIQNLLRLVEQGIDTEDVGDRIMELNAQKADLNKRIAKEENRKPVINEDRVTFWLTSFLTSGDIDDIEYRQRIIDTLVHRVYLFDGDDGGKKVVITYNVTNGVRSTVTLSDVKGYLKSSFFKSFPAPMPTNPNFFVIKHKVGIVIEIKGRD